jgi:hypothetical protein
MTRSTLALGAFVALLSACGDRPVFGPPMHPDSGLPDAAALDGAARDGGPHDAGIGDVGLGDAALSPDAALADGGLDGGRDGGLDAGLDGGRDAGGDAGSDGGPRRGPAPVVLGSPGDLASAGAYALIGKTGITNVTGSMISGGHLGVSPASATAITGFSLILDASGQFSTSVAVVPPARVYAGDYAVPTPANLTSAILSMEGAYTDAAGRPGPDFLDLLTGHIGGLVPVPGLYRWGSSVDVTNGITLVGGADDVWIFQITGDLDVSDAVGMTLAGGAVASNVFWQVAGQTTIHTDAHFEGVLLCSTGITLQTGASLHGRALAQTLVALDDNAIVAP